MSREKRALVEDLVRQLSGGCALLPGKVKGTVQGDDLIFDVEIRVRRKVSYSDAHDHIEGALAQLATYQSSGSRRRAAIAVSR